jgi:hypothetical protein
MRVLIENFVEMRDAKLDSGEAVGEVAAGNANNGAGKQIQISGCRNLKPFPGTSLSFSTADEPIHSKRTTNRRGRQLRSGLSSSGFPEQLLVKYLLFWETAQVVLLNSGVQRLKGIQHVVVAFSSSFLRIFVFTSF